jgi:hypothetical protein
MLIFDNKLKKTFGLYDTAIARYNIVWTFAGIFYAILSFFRKIPENVDYLFLCHDVHRHTLEKGKFYAPLIDPIVSELNEKNVCLTLATPFSRRHGSNCFGDVQNHNFVVLIALLQRLLSRKDINRNDIEQDPLVLAYKRLLNKIQPKVIIGIQPSIEFCVAAKQLGIITYDMQHGLISDVNYYSVKKRELLNQQGWPDYILCWDEQSAERVNRITNRNSKPCVIGNPSYHSKYGAYLDKEDYKYKASTMFKFDVLVTATHNYGLLVEDQLYREIGIPNHVINLIKNTPEVFWRIRLHPVMVMFHSQHINTLLKKEFENCINIDWETYSHVSLGNALKGCLGHITVESASALDAAQNSVPTLLVGYPGVLDEKKARAYFGEYIQSGVMAFVDMADCSVDSLDFFRDFANEGSLGNNSLTSRQRFSAFIKDIEDKGELLNG